MKKNDASLRIEHWMSAERLRETQEKLRRMGPEEFLGHTQMVLEEHNRRKVGAMDVMVERMVENGRMPVVIIPMGDLHIGSGATDLVQIKERVERILRDPRCYVIFTGDLIESVETKHGVDSVQAALPIQEQIRLVREAVIEPLYNGGRVIAAVTGHRAHEGAMSSQVGDDAWKRMFDGYDIPLVANGGMVHLTLIDKEQVERKLDIQVFHNTPGRSGDNVLRPLEKIAKGYSPENVPDLILGAHDHRSAVANWPDTVLVRGGTPKGSRGNPDPYGVALGLSGTDPASQGIVFWSDGNTSYSERDFMGMGFIDSQVGLTVVAALRLWEGLRARRLDEEVLGEIAEREEQQRRIVLEKGRPNMGLDKLMEGGKEGGQVQSEVHWGVETPLPTGLWMLANLRFGSRTRNAMMPDGTWQGYQDKWIQEMLARPDVLVVLGRQLVDRKVPADGGREDYLEEAADYVATAGRRILAALYDATLKSERWLKPVREMGEVVSDGMWAASDLAERLQVPLLQHMGLLEINLNGVTYSAVVLDKLEGRGSTAFATGGILSVYRNRLYRKPGIVMGGHMPGAGVAQFYDWQNSETITPTLVAPGWAATHANWSVGSIVESTADGPGPGVILMPGGLGIFERDRAVIPVGKMSEWELLAALRALAAARIGWINARKLVG